MSISNSDITAKNLKKFYEAIYPYLNSEPGAIGSIICILDEDVPEHYIECNGQIVNISEYSKLAQYFANKFGASNYFGGDGISTFGIPEIKFTEGSWRNIDSASPDSTITYCIATENLHINYLNSGGGGEGGHVIQNASGTALTQRPNLKFVGASVTDNASASATVVEVDPVESLTAQQLQDIKNAFVISQPQPFPPYCTIGVGGGYAPIGSIIAYMGLTAPEDYLVCNGATYNISDYKQLADFIKSQFGSSNYFGGDGSTTFAVPDLRGEFLRGAGTNTHSAQGSGASVGTHQDATSIPYMRNLGKSNTLIQVRDNDAVIEPSNMDASVAGPFYGNLKMSERNQEGFDLPSSYSARPTNTSVLYCIKARATGGSDYSTDEKTVGVWVDGKPLYQKSGVFSRTDFESGTNNWNYFVLLDLPNDATLIKIDGIISIADYGLATIGVKNTLNGTASWSSNFSYAKRITMDLQSIPIDKDITLYITVQYTKTTD